MPLRSAEFPALRRGKQDRMLEYETCTSLYQREVDKFKKQLLQKTLEEHRGYRTRAAHALGLQRTYLVRLLRQFDINVPREWER